ncbi:hypothetical protein EDB84DRAFT_1556688 [Lactarius hengduanensis]|nr:hypothetical protein EDB84DRAFT_1556688 [Lactarius hengduanensis]
MLPHYQARHDGQQVGFQGAHLAEKRRKEILTRTPEINADSIRSLGDNRYSVQSERDTSRKYLVGLSERSCDCPDWPRVRLCKHVAVVAHFFGEGDQLVELAADAGAAPKTVQPIESECTPDARSDATVTSILEEVITVSQEFLCDGVPKSPGTVRSLHGVKEHLTAVVRNSRSSESPLPDKEDIPPNQHTWTKTAQRMGVQRRKRRRATTTSSSPEPAATERIGDLNRKQARVKITDPYSGGVNSGRHAAPDAQSVAQNARACARAAVVANGVEPALPQPQQHNRERVGTSAPAIPQSSPLQSYPPSSAAPLPALAPLAWYTTRAAPGAQATVPMHNAYAPSAPPPSSSPLAWYPTPSTYPPMYTQSPYQVPYPTYWPYGHFHTPQPRPQ